MQILVMDSPSEAARPLNTCTASSIWRIHTPPTRPVKITPLTFIIKQDISVHSEHRTLYTSCDLLYMSVEDIKRLVFGHT